MNIALFSNVVLYLLLLYYFVHSNNLIYFNVLNPCELQNINLFVVCDSNFISFHMQVYETPSQSGVILPPDSQQNARVNDSVTRSSSKTFVTEEHGLHISILSFGHFLAN